MSPADRTRPSAEGRGGEGGQPERSADELERAAALLSRLVKDSEFRTRFQRDPVAACRVHGLPDLADQLSEPRGMHTLDLRESKSSLAGVVLAAAFEGVSAYQLLERLGPSVAADVGGVIDRALTLSHLDTIKGALSGGPSASAAPAAPAAGAIPGVEPATPGLGAEAAGTTGAVPDEESDVETTAGEEADGGEAQAAEEGAAAAEGDESESAGGDGASTEALLDNPNLDLPPEARADIEAGELDPRLGVVLDRLTEEHQIELSVIKSGHDQFTSSGSVSNHFHGRGLDIASVDGQPVNPGNVAAREVATLIAELEGDVRPTEVGTPFPISAPGFFTDGAHLDHIHVAFDTELPEDFQAPAGEGEPEVEDVEEDAGAEASGFEGSDGDLEYPGDDAPKAELAGWLAAHAQEAGLPPELPVMAALVESDLANLNFGDADSVGFFQMRVGIWNTGEYAGYPENPELQIKWFIDNALAVKEQQGLTGDDPSAYGEWIADVERPAEQYRGRYQLELEQARELLEQAGTQTSAPADAGSADAPAEPSKGPEGMFAPERGDPDRDTVQFMPAVDFETPQPAAEAAGEAAAASAGAGAPAGGAAEMVSWAESKIGTTEGSAAQVEWASSLGLDASLPWCSIFVANGLEELGVPLPASPAYSGAWLDWEGGSTVELSEIQPGDLVIYDWGDGGITDHIALYTGDEKVVGGNQSDMVSEVPLERGSVVGVVRPDYPG